MKSLLRLVCSLVPAAAAWMLLSTTANATVFNFATDPFAGSAALVTPGRQVVGGEDSITFSIATDVFSFASGVFGIGDTINFASGLAGALPTGGVNAIALLSFDDDANAATAFGAGNAANLIAAQITTPGPGFFIYFNQGLDLPRLVFSTDLNDNTADLKIMARMQNLGGQPGRDAMSTFTAANFQISRVPEPASSLTVIMAVAALMAGSRVFRRAGAEARAG
jgi:hypothetical protein